MKRERATWTHLGVGALSQDAPEEEVARFGRCIEVDRVRRWWWGRHVADAVAALFTARQAEAGQSDICMRVVQEVNLSVYVHSPCHIVYASVYRSSTGLCTIAQCTPKRSVHVQLRPCVLYWSGRKMESGLLLPSGSDWWIKQRIRHLRPLDPLNTMRAKKGGQTITLFLTFSPPPFLPPPPPTRPLIRFFSPRPPHSNPAIAHNSKQGARFHVRTRRKSHGVFRVAALLADPLPRHQPQQEKLQDQRRRTQPGAFGVAVV